MKRTTLTLGLLAAMLVLSPAVKYAQAQDMKLHATIPFDFRVGDRILPAGDYRVDVSNHVIRFNQNDGGGAALVFATSERLQGHPANGGIEFKRYGDVYLLSRLLTPWANEAATPIRTKAEARLARDYQGVPTTVAGLVK